MAKVKYKTSWFCSDCGAESPKWAGRCPSCGAWNTMVEERVAATTSRSPSPVAGSGKSQLQVLNEIQAEEMPRIKLPSGELNRVLGGGLVPGEMVLIGGEPGVGKSTLVLQNLLAIRSKTILYASGEESALQLKMRADRLERGSDNLFIVCETSLENILEHIEQLNPGIVVVDSIQTIASDALDSSAGSVSQVRECAARLLKYAKESGTPVILIGHITKDGSLAGPKVLEHIVDAVLQFEGDRQYMFRILRANKNRFGNTAELGIYEMGRKGLREVVNPSELLMPGGDTQLSGVSIGVTIDGARPFLIETQALVSTAAYGTPQRSVTGFDSRRVNMLLAVLEKRVGFKLAAKDVFLNIAGGLKVNDPAMDLPVVCAILSSNFDIAIGNNVCMCGEISLSGEIRPVSRIEQRIAEAQKLGMEQIIIPEGNIKGIDTSGYSIRITEASRVAAVAKEIFS